MLQPSSEEPPREIGARAMVWRCIARLSLKHGIMLEYHRLHTVRSMQSSK
jgi:hypothetical protein